MRRVAPWLVGAAILAVVATRIPLASFRRSIGQGPHLVLALTDVALVSVVLCSDSVSTWIGLIALGMRRRLSEVLAVRGATYLLFLLNYAAGQGGFGYYLHRGGVPVVRAVGATLFLIGTNLAMLLLATTAAWAVHGPGESPALWRILITGCCGFVLYLGVIAIRPRFLAARELLAPLFESGISGHLLALAGRLPHVVAIVIGQWLAIRAWGIAVPFTAGMTLMPVVVIASVLPISPAGLGTTQAALVYFFQDYAAGATADDRSANLLVFGVVHFVYGIAASVVVGLACAASARRIARAPAAAATELPAP